MGDKGAALHIGVAKLTRHYKMLITYLNCTSLVASGGIEFRCI